MAVERPPVLEVRAVTTYTVTATCGQCGTTSGAQALGSIVCSDETEGHTHEHPMDAVLAHARQMFAQERWRLEPAPLCAECRARRN